MNSTQAQFPFFMRETPDRTGDSFSRSDSIRTSFVAANLSRRSFIRNMSLATGSVFVLGILPGCSRDELPAVVERAEASGSFAEAGFQPNVFVGINEAGDVFVVNPRSEMGQGVRSSVHVVIADEMGADLDRVYQEQAVGDAKYGDQNTDGSTSMRNLFDQWRTAGAAAREMLVAAAAAEWSVAADECEVANHTVRHAATNQSADFGALAAKAATMDVPSDPAFIPESKWRYIGTELRGYDNRDIVTGRAIFGMDVTRPDMLFASVEHCPTILGKLVSYDDSKAREVPGVVDVVEVPIADAPVHFKALGGIAVVATNTWAAFKGREALEIEWDLGPNADYNTDTYRQTLKESLDAGGTAVLNMGDADAALSSADSRHEVEYYVPMQAHAPMEPPNATAWFKEDGSVECWAPTQNPQAARSSVAQYVGIDEESVTVHVTLLGGAFGRKSKADFVVEAAHISKAVGAPVKLTWTREDATKFDYFHAPSLQRISAALDDGGAVTAWRHRSAFPTISSTFAAGADTPSGGEMSLGATTVAYEVPNMRVEACRAPAHVRIGWLRSVCNIHHAFATNAFAGELAQRAGRDQLEFMMGLIGSNRHLNVRFPDNPPYGDPAPIDTARIKAVLQKAADEAGWGQQSLAEGEGMGCAVQYSFGSYVAWVVKLAVEDDSFRVIRAYGVIDCGTAVNPDRVRSQMEGSFVFGLTLAKYGKLTVTDGTVNETNYNTYQLARMSESPPTSITILNTENRPGGVGEPGLPPVAPAIANAILSATGTPVRELPITLS